MPHVFVSTRIVCKRKEGKEKMRGERGKVYQKKFCKISEIPQHSRIKGNNTKRIKGDKVCTHSVCKCECLVMTCPSCSILSFRHFSIWVEL